MKRIRLIRWAGQLQPPRNPRIDALLRCPFQCQASERASSTVSIRQTRRGRASEPHSVVGDGRETHCMLRQSQRRHATTRRKASSAAAAVQAEDSDSFIARPSFAGTSTSSPSYEQPDTSPRQRLSAPRPSQARDSPKLSALHARLSLPSSLPLQTLARCLMDPTVDSRPGYNNAPLALLGSDILGYYTAEWLLCHYPRLPMPVLFAAQYAYVGAKTLAALRGEWGVETVAAPGTEVDPGLLQFRRMIPGNAMAEGQEMRVKDMPGVSRLRVGRRSDQGHWRRGMSGRIVYDDQFGDAPDALSAAMDGPTADGASSDLTSSELSSSGSGHSITSENASANFLRAVFGALSLHTTPTITRAFHNSHILTRHLELHTLFNFTHPTRDLSRLCAREGFEPPVARLISETGRLSRSPVFVVGVYSGGEKLGEGVGSSLNEARVRAAAAGLRGWYLYSPVQGEIRLPSQAGAGPEAKGKEWKPQTIDIGEIVT